MEWNAQQKATLKAWIDADPVFGATAPNDGAAAQQIANALNALASPVWVIWKLSVTPEEWAAAIVGGGGATQLDALTASKRDSLFYATSRELNPSEPQIRAALDDFCGSQNVLKSAVQAVQKRNATVGEKLFSTGTGVTNNPATTVLDQPISAGDVLNARNA